ncbi:MAG: transglycosylase SLT domain-containing protein [Chloracidobacterium sp.]|nr:transglycosylase SLT domain-containing protein [Chloracidobacterium sp.]
MRFIKVFGFTAFLFLAFGSFASGQITSSRSSNDTSTSQIDAAQVASNKVLFDAGVSFKEGLLAYTDGNRPVAGEKFNKSVEVFLYSALNIQKDPKLQGCYNQLIETVYRIEFPYEAQLPQVNNLALTCGWSIDTTIVDAVAKVSRSAAAKTPAGATVATTSVSGRSSTGGPNSGFNSQEFEPSPLDELSKVELTSDELQIESNPVAQQQYQYIQTAVANRSLGFAFQVHPLIQQYINYFRGRGRTTMEVGLYRSGMFMRMARRIFKEEGVPENVAWLGQVESAWKPSAYSSAAASGLWQFIPGTGARYGLQRNAYVDERNSFEEATRASAKYLKFLHDRYNNWELGIAAYNCGEGNVDKAIRRAGVTNFWAAYAYLPSETRVYVPMILATILVANNPNEYGFGHIRPAAPLVYDRVRIPASTNLSLVAQSSDTTVQYLRYLNPHLRGNVTPPVPYIINVPAGKANEIVAVFRRIPATKLNNTNLANTSSGETWQTISNRTGVSVADLMAANQGMATPRGKVFVPVAGNGVNNIVYQRPTTSGAAALPSSVRIVKAKAGDTVQKVAERAGADATVVAKYNGLLPNSVLTAGREIKIPAK